MTSESNKETKDRIAQKIASGILSMQTRFSNRMNRLRNLKLILVGFCVISGSLSMYYFVNAIVSKPKATIRIDRIRSRGTFEAPPGELFHEKIPEEIYRSIQVYRRYMDSTGEAIRPGLSDSMRTLEDLYLQQQNK